MKVLILGGGAGGMLAALSAAEDGNAVTVLERQNRVGRKLLATGNGRCNLTNLHAEPARYHGQSPQFVRCALERFSVERTLDFFHELGLYTVAESDGKVYPLSDQANSVVDVLRFAMEQRGVQVITGQDIISAGTKARGFTAVAATGECYYGDKLIVAAGGCAGKNLGGTKSGYKLLGAFGHSCTALHPALVQIKTDPRAIRGWKGIRADCALTLKEDGHAVAQDAGEVQFTEYGVSGPVAFSLSRRVSVGAGEQLLLADFLRNTGESELREALTARAARFPDLPAEQLLTGMVNSRLGQSLVRDCGVELQTPLRSLTGEQLAQIAHRIKFAPLPVEGVLGMEHAQVTAGGVPTAEFRADTLESRKCPGLFATGEVLDVDGDCGGFNLQWAWSSGYVAGKLGKL